MRIIDAEWDPRANKLHIECDDCGRRFKHRSNRKAVICPKCLKRAYLVDLREKYVEEHDG